MVGLLCVLQISCHLPFPTICISNQNKITDLIQAFDKAKTTKGKPTAIVAITTKGKGVSFMENQVSWHGKAPNEEQYKQAMEELQ